MPPVSEFKGEHRRRRWSAYLRQYVGERITTTTLNNCLGPSRAANRVTAWLNGTRGLGEDAAWDVGRALREHGADTNEVEAVWAGGFFGAIVRLLQRG